LVRTPAGSAGGFEGLAEVVGQGSAAVMAWVPAWIPMVRQRRAVQTNFLIDQAVPLRSSG
jgi:hypothetical protein